MIGSLKVEALLSDSLVNLLPLLIILVIYVYFFSVYMNVYGILKNKGRIVPALFFIYLRTMPTGGQELLEVCRKIIASLESL